MLEDNETEKKKIKKEFEIKDIFIKKYSTKNDKRRY